MNDLNLLKSWNPKLTKNKKKVWQAQQDLLEENRKIKERQKEIAKERELNKLTNLSRDGSVKPKKSTGLEWMYVDTEKANDSDDYLLGRKQLDESLATQKKEEHPNKQATTQNAVDVFESSQNLRKPTDFANTNYDDLSNDDPMTKIRKAQNARRSNSSVKTERQLKSAELPTHFYSRYNSSDSKVHKRNTSFQNKSRYQNNYSSRYSNKFNEK